MPSKRNPTKRNNLVKNKMIIKQFEINKKEHCIIQLSYHKLSLQIFILFMYRVA